MRVAILHPDLGIGGAEMLIINLALALKAKGYGVKVYTPHFDPNRCFKECEQLDIEVIGSWFPRTMLGGRLIAFCAYMRMFFAAIWLTMFSGETFDYYIMDQVSFPMPVLRVFSSRILFYCHFPDKLLSTNRGSIVMRFYRFFLDLAEEYTTGMANEIVVNSEFTLGIFRENFPYIAETRETKGGRFCCCFRRHTPKVLYPAINLKAFEKSADFDENSTVKDLLKDQIDESILNSSNLKVFTSLNRYERKKGIDLAILAFA